jgi:hypothetical protein
MKDCEFWLILIFLANAASCSKLDDIRSYVKPLSPAEQVEQIEKALQ